jgi:hypothetical protein
MNVHPNEEEHSQTLGINVQVELAMDDQSDLPNVTCFYNFRWLFI